MLFYLCICLTSVLFIRLNICHTENAHQKLPGQTNCTVSIFIAIFAIYLFIFLLDFYVAEVFLISGTLDHFHFYNLSSWLSPMM